MKSRYFTINLCFLFSKLNTFLYVDEDKESEVDEDQAPDETLKFENQKLSKAPMHMVEKKTSRSTRRNGK